MATTSKHGHLKHVPIIAEEDAKGLINAHQSYGDSWKKRGGIGAYMVMIRKFDRMENHVKRHGYDVVAAIKADQRAEGLIDDIRDARRYLNLIESWLRELGLVKAGDHRDNRSDDHHHPQCGCGECLEEHDRQAERLADDLKDDPRCAVEAVPPAACIRHIPDSKCTCSHCLGKKELSQRSPSQLMEVAKRLGVDTNTAEYAAIEACRRYHHRMICNGHGCDDPAHEGVHESAHRALDDGLRRLYEDNPHPVGCICDICERLKEEKSE
jgi:hypothetical protein